MTELFRNNFPGTKWIPWSEFTFPTGNPNFAVPVLDGYNHGMASLSAALLWRARSIYYPGQPDYDAALTAQWKNPSGSSRWCGVIVRFKDWNNLISLRLRSSVNGSPVLQLITRVGGVESNRDESTAIPVSAMLAGVTWSAKVVDEDDGTTTVTGIYNDTELVTWNGELPTLRGTYTCGVELGEHAQGDDILVGPLVCSDVATTLTPDDPTAGEGWWVEIGSTLYSPKQLRDIGVDLVDVNQSFGTQGGTANLSIQGSFVEHPILYPGRLVKIYQDGYCRFNGYVSGNPRQAVPTESQVVMCRGALWRSRQVHLRLNDLTSTHFFNVYDTASEYYNPDLQNMSIGDVIEYLFTRYEEELRFFGAYGGFVRSELDQMTAVISDLNVRGTFIAAILSLLKFAPDHDVIVTPADKVWHFRDITALTADDVRLTTEHVTLRITPSREDSYTAVEIIGGIRQDKPPQLLKLSDGSLKKAWTDEQEENYTKDKTNLDVVTSVITGSGHITDVSDPYYGRDWVSIRAADTPTTGDFRGAVTQLQGHTRLVINNEGSRFYLSAPTWSTPPELGDPVTFSLVSNQSMSALSAAGVGRGFIGPSLEELCPGADYGQLKNLGWCGNAKVTTLGEDGNYYSQEYAYSVQIDAQKRMSDCGAAVMLSAPAKPAVGMINYLPPGRSPTLPACQPGTLNQKQRMVDVELNVSQYAEQAAYIREPVEGYDGNAYSDNEDNWSGGGDPEPGDWAVRQRLVVSVPTFVNEDVQGDGFRAWAQALLKVHSQKQYLFDVTLATPWLARSHTRPGLATTSRYADLTKKLTISSARRITGFEDINDAPIYRVSWKVKQNQTVLTAGTIGGWKAPDAASIRKLYTDDYALEKSMLMIQQLETFRNSLISKPPKVMPQQGGPVDGCDVTIINDNSRRVTNVNDDEKNKNAWMNHLALKGKASDLMDSGVNTSHPGTDPVAPGFDAELVTDDGELLGSSVPYDVPSTAPDSNVLNADRGRYGGDIQTDEREAGAPPDIIYKRGNVAFRKSGDNPRAGIGLEFARVDGTGSPQAWQPYKSNLDLWQAGVNPRDALNSRGILHDHEQAIQTVMKDLLRVENDVGRIAEAGETTSNAPDGVPADLLDLLKSDAFAEFFRVVTTSDPGGVVFHGPMTDFGVDSEMLWRVHPAVKMLLNVVQVAQGLGTNGGDFEWAGKSQGKNTEEFLKSGTVVHKQIHSSELQESHTTPGLTKIPASQNLWGFVDGIGVLPGGMVGAVIGLPHGATGVPVFGGVAMEDPTAAPVPAGTTFPLAIDYQYKNSPYAGQGTTINTTSVKGDGAGTATGKFMGPGDQVPPGLRQPFGPGAAAAIGVSNNGPNPVIVVGLNVEMAVIDGGVMLMVTEGMTAAEATRLSREVVHEVVGVQEAIELHVTMPIEESVSILESISIELDPPIAVQERCTITEKVELELL